MKKRVIKKITIFLTSSFLIGVGVFLAKLNNKKNFYKDKYKNVLFFKNLSLNYKDKKINEESYALFFSSLEINFLEAKLDNNRAVLNLYGELCGISIKIPSTWNVKTNGKGIKSGINNDFEFNVVDMRSPLLVINYDLKLCGIDIKKIEIFSEEDEVENYFVDEGEDDTKVIRIQRL